MKQVSYLRLFVLLCGITLVIGETIKVDTDNTRNATADNETNKKGLSFTLFRRFIIKVV